MMYFVSFENSRKILEQADGLQVYVYMGQDYILSSPFLEAEIWLVTISNF